MRWRREPARHGHVDHTHIGLAQQMPGPGQSRLHPVLLGRTVQVAPCQTFQLPRGKTNLSRDIRGAQRLIQLRFHQLHRFGELRIADTDPTVQREPLAIMLSPYRSIDQPLSRLSGQFLAMVIFDDRQRQVSRRRPARG